MTTKEMSKAIAEECSKRTCDGCPIGQRDVINGYCRFCFTMGNKPDAEEYLRENYRIMFGETASEAKETRREILESAIKCVCSDRDKQYGSPENSFSEIAKLWSVYLDREITAHDVGILMTLFTVQGCPHKDGSLQGGQLRRRGGIYRLCWRNQ